MLQRILEVIWSKFLAREKVFLLPKVRSATRCLKANTREARLVERKVSFILEASNRGRRQTRVQRPAPPLTISGQELLKGIFRGV